MAIVMIYEVNIINMSYEFLFTFNSNHGFVSLGVRDGDRLLKHQRLFGLKDRTFRPFLAWTLGHTDRWVGLLYFFISYLNIGGKGESHLYAGNISTMNMYA